MPSRTSSTKARRPAPAAAAPSASPSVSVARGEDGNKKEFSIFFGLFSAFSLLAYNYSILILVCFLGNIDLALTTGFQYACLGFECPSLELRHINPNSFLFPLAPSWLISSLKPDDQAKVAATPSCPMCPTPAFLINLSLFLIFALQHSGMARESYKKVAVSIGCPDRIERSVYVLASSLCVLLICFAWVPMKTYYSFFIGSDAPFSYFSFRTISMLSLQLVGALLLVYSSITFKGLLGVEKAWFGIDAEKKASSHCVITTSAHGIIRHPMMTGLMLTICPSPFYAYTSGRIMFSACICLYVVIAVIFIEEPDLEVKTKGYKKYKESVKYRFVPGVL